MFLHHFSLFLSFLLYLCTRNYQSPCNDCLELSYYETETNTIGGQTIPCAFILITSLFFLWGFAHAILNVLNKHFQEILDITKTHSAFIQMTMYMGYFIMAIPAGLFISRFGYRRGVVFGLLLYGIGSLLFYPRAALSVF